jgi:RimJ/RimL family protein N-acetyltransferase
MSALAVRRLEEEDLRTRVDWFNDPSVYNQMSLNVPMSLSDTRRWFAQNALSESRRDFSFLSREGRDAGELVAMGGLTGIQLQSRQAEFYILARPGLTGRGIGGAAVRWLCNYGFLRLGLERIYGFTVEHSEDARRLYDRIGFAREGIMRRHIWHQGRLIDRHIHGLLRSEWERLAWRVDVAALADASLDKVGPKERTEP